MNYRGLIKSGIWIMIARTVGAGLLFWMSLFFARVLGASDFGLFSLGMTLFTILATVARVGMDSVCIKQIAANIDCSPALARGYFFSILKLVLITNLFFMAMVFILGDFLATKFFNKPELSAVIQVFSLGLVPFSFVVIISEALKSLNKPLLSSVLRAILIPLLAICVGWLLLFSNLDTLNLFVLGYVCASAVTSIFAWFLFWKYLPRIQSELIRLVSLLKEGLPMLMVTSGALVMNWSDIVILGVYLDSGNVGVYSAASRTVMITSLILVAVNALMAPKYASLYSNDKIDEIKKLSHKASIVLLAFVFFPTVILLFFPAWVLSFFGEEFVAGSYILMVLAVGQFVNVACGSVGFLLSMTGNEKTLQAIFLVTAVMNLILSIFLVERFQEIGVAIATALSVIVWNIWSMFMVKRRLGFWTISFRP